MRWWQFLQKERSPRGTSEIHPLPQGTWSVQVPRGYAASEPLGVLIKPGSSVPQPHLLCCPSSRGILPLTSSAAQIQGCHYSGPSRTFFPRFQISLGKLSIMGKGTIRFFLALVLDHTFTWFDLWKHSTFSERFNILRKNNHKHLEGYSSLAPWAWTQ